MKNIFVSFMIFLMCSPLSQMLAQDEFTFSDSIVYLEKTIESFNVHWYIEIFNEDNVERDMTWEANFSSYPADWLISFDDQSNYYENVLHNDSHDFVLKKDLDLPQKLIIGVFHNGAIGHGQLAFKIFEKNNPNQHKTIIYDITFLPKGFIAANELPSIKIVNNSFNNTNRTLEIFFEIDDEDNDYLNVAMYYKDANETGYVRVNNATGDIGDFILKGSDKKIDWIIDSNMNLSDFEGIRITVEDGEEMSVHEIIDKVDPIELENMLYQIAEEDRHKSNPLYLNSVKDYLKASIINAGLNLDDQEWMEGNYTANNYIGHKEGVLNPEKIVLNDAHYDTVNDSPGADDNGSGVVGVLAAMKILKDYSFENSIDFCFFDLEEDGLIGSINYVTNLVVPNNQDILGVLNYEMIGFYDESPGAQSLPTGFNLLFPDAYQAVIDNDSKGDFISNVANENSIPLKNTFDSISQFYVPDLKVISFAAPGNSEIAPDLRRSDHTPFWETGYQALMLSDGANFRNLNYHEETDVVETLDMPFMTNVVKATLATIVHLAKPFHGTFDEVEIDILNSTSKAENCVFKIEPTIITANVLNLTNSNCGSLSVDLQVFNTSGSLIFEKKECPITSNQIEIPNLDEGIYFLKTKVNNHITTQKFCKF